HNLSLVYASAEKFRLLPRPALPEVFAQVLRGVYQLFPLWNEFTPCEAEEPFAAATPSFVFIFLRTILRFFALHKNSSLLLAWDFRTLAKITRVGSPLYANSMLPSIGFPPPH